VNVEAARPVSVFYENLGFGQFTSAEYRDALKVLLAAKYDKKSIGVIVAIGSSALEYVLSERNKLWPGVPVVFTFVDSAFLKRLKLPPDVTGQTASVRFSELLLSAKALVRDLQLVVLLGEPLEKQVHYRYLKDEIANASGSGVEVIDLTGLPIRDIRKRVSALSDRSAIIYTALYSDGEGAAYAPPDALAHVAEVANRPIVIGVETYFGRGGTGGMVITSSKLGMGAARLALRILDGEPLSAMPVSDSGAASYMFDWRQLRRWGVGEASLPAGSEVRFRPLSVWDQYQWQVVLVAMAILLQAALIIGLLHEHRRRSIAEEEALRRVNELAHINRVATAGELSATIAHELKQPLTAIISNGSAGLRWLGRQMPDIEQAQAILKRIVREGERANRIIDDIRAMFRKDSGIRAPVDINELIRETVSLVEIEIERHDVLLQTTLAEHPKAVALVDRVQIQQVILNLIMNAVEAMSAMTERQRLLRISSSTDENHAILVTVQDSGPGIDAGNMEKIFDSFFTTKPNGMGLGLPICRSIIEAHGGRLWADADVPHGTVFKIFLPGNKEHFRGRTEPVSAVEA
jgi:signal transduction histidine kinase